MVYKTRNRKQEEFDREKR